MTDAMMHLVPETYMADENSAEIDVIVFLLQLIIDDEIISLYS